MSHLNRVASGSGGLPPTFGSPLLSGGLESPGSKGFAAEFNVATLSKNIILSNLSYQEKLRTFQALLKYTNAGPGSFTIIYLTSQEADAQRIYSDLDLNSKANASFYSSESSGSGSNYTWFKELKQGLVITPASHMLLALDRGLVNLSSLSHLVVDDAHLIALEDVSSPLSKIFLDHYGKLPIPERPRILGLTHYALQLEANFGFFAWRMEQLLDAQILGDLDMKRAEIVDSSTRLEISVLEYEPHEATLPTLPPNFHPAFEAATVELGGWCAPLLSFFNPDSDSEGLITGKRVVKMPPPEAMSSIRTPKFNEVLKYLNAVSELPHFRCIIIVKNPFAALALEWYLSVNQQTKVRSSLYLDHLKIDHESGSREALEEDFKNGPINTLICTESILSGIDGDFCSHVIWFNSYGSLISFAQSRLLACQGGASLVLLVERGNRGHYQAARDVLHMENSVSNWVLNMGTDGAPIPPRQLANCPRFNGTPIIINPSQESSTSNPYIQDPISGSRIYPQDSEEVLYRFLADRADEDTALIPTRIFSYEQTPAKSRDSKANWLCRIQVDLCDQPLSVVGEPSSCKALTRGSACFRACSTLFHLGRLSSSFFPSRPLHTWQHGILQPPKTKVAIDTYYALVSPLFWHNCLLAAPSSLFYPNLVRLGTEGSDAYRGILLLTRIPLANVDEFSLFSNQTELKVSLIQYAPLSLNTEQLELVLRYTLNLWRILGNKPYDSPSGELAYFVVPLKPGSKLEVTHVSRTIPIEPFVSWREVNDLVSFRVRPLDCENMDKMSLDLLDSVIQDRPNDFTRRFQNAKLRQDLNPLSLIMQEKPGNPQISLLDYYRTHRHEFEGIKNLQQPLIEATLLPGLSNQLNPQEPSTQLSTNYLVPEMCYISSIPASTFRAASFMPSVIWHIENLLIAKEVNLTFFQGQIRDELAMYALCSRMAHRTFSYERLEFLGDTFIKYAASAYLYGTEPTAASRTLHARRQKMVNNRSLWLGAQALGLPPCIQSEVFRPKQWFIPNVTVLKKNQTQGEGPSATEQARLLSSRQFSRQIPPKAIADVVEAMIGAALLSGGEKLAFSVAKILGLAVPKTCDWLDVVSYAPRPSELVLSKGPDYNREILEGVMKIIGVPVDSPELLLQAMQHPSMARCSESYERLEFLGDAVLDMLVVQSFFSDEEKWSPHNMTLIKSTMVSNRALAIICIESGLHRYLMHDMSSLAQSIIFFIEEVEACKRVAQTDAQRLKYWSKLVAPKALGDVVESLLGAIYVSSGFSISRVKMVYDRLLKPFYDRYIDKKAMLTHPMSRLMKKLESVGCRAFGITKTETELGSGTGFKCEVKLHGRVIAEATYEKPQLAITQATELALNQLEAQPDRVLVNCTCRVVSQGKKRKRASPEETEEGEVDEPLPGDDADHPIDVDMFDF